MPDTLPIRIVKSSNTYSPSATTSNFEIGSTQKAYERHRMLSLRAPMQRIEQYATYSRNEGASSHSMTSSARASKVVGMSSPMVFAALWLITSSNFVGCSIGKSPGLAPLRTLST